VSQDAHFQQYHAQFGHYFSVSMIVFDILKRQVDSGPLCSRVHDPRQLT
jgi:hypothetical protein